METKQQKLYKDIKSILQAESINSQIERLEKILRTTENEGVKLILPEMIKEAKKIKKQVEDGKLDLDNMKNDDEQTDEDKDISDYYYLMSQSNKKV